jgi:Helix-turn-helix domain
MDKTEQDIQTMPEFAWLRDDKKEWYQAREIEEGLGYTTSTIRRYCEAGKFPGARLYTGGSLQRGGWRIPRSGIITFLRERTLDKDSQAM